MTINERVYGGFRRTIGDATGEQLAILLPTDYRVLHLASAADHATDWGVANPTNPTFYIHSETTPSTDYLSLAHDGTNGVLTLSGGGLSISSSAVYIGDSANAGITVGLTINQGENDDSVIDLKSADVATGITDDTITGIVAETDTYYTVGKRSATTGGVVTTAYAEAAAEGTIALEYIVGGTATTTKTASGRSLKELVFYEHNGSNARANITADGNIFGIRAYVGGAVETKFMVDEDGDLFADGSATTVYDDMPDAMMVRAVDRAKSDNGARGYIEGQWDDYTIANEQALVDTGILGAPLADGGLINVTRLQQLHNGAIWQLWSDVLDVAKALPAAAQEKLPDRIKDRFLALNAG